MLEVKGLHLSYGPVTALTDISLEVKEGEVVSLLGANGAGKTSLLRAISGLEKISQGSVSFAGKPIHKLKAPKIVKLGIAHSPEGRHIFPEMTVQENLEMGAYTLKSKVSLQENLEKAFEYLPRLAERRKQKGGTLSGGEQQMLAVARAMMSNPRLLMLDEPSLGLAPQIIEQIFSIITQINEKEGVTVFLVEQNANEALLHSNRAYVLESGELTMQGDSEQLRHDPRVIEAYLGV